MNEIDRRTFVQGGVALGAATLVGSTRSALGAALGSEIPDVVAVKGDDAFAGTYRAIDALGGMGRFVTKGARVGLLVNAPRFWRLEGTYTRTDVVLAVAKLCLDAGAKELVTLCPLAPGFWQRTPLSQKHLTVQNGVKEGSTERVERRVERGVSLAKAKVSKDLLDVDVFINLPVAKHHSGSHFTGNLKNFMGGLARDTCKFFHEGSARFIATGAEDDEFLAQCIADVNTLRRPSLCVLDATVVLASNGPEGPGDLLRPRKVVVGVDPVAVDAYGVTLHGRRPAEVPMLAKAVAHGLGRLDLSKLVVRELAT